MQYRAMKQKLPKKKENLKKAFTLSNFIKEQSLQMANTIQSRTQLVSLWLFLLPYILRQSCCRSLYLFVRCITHPFRSSLACFYHGFF